MNRNILNMLTLLVILGILTGCYREFGGPGSTISPGVNVNKQPENEESPKLELDSCKEDIDYKTKNEDVCASLIAIDNNDLAACKNIKEGEFKDKCYSGIAQKRWDSLICANAGSEKENCEFSIGFDSEGNVVCEKVKEKWGHLSSNECYTKVAALTKDKSYCDKLEYGKFDSTSEYLGSSKEEVMNACFLDMAKFNKDESFCRSITQENEKKSCYNSVRKIKFANPVCESIQEPNKSICYIDPCSYIKDEVQKNECLLAYQKS